MNRLHVSWSGAVRGPPLVAAIDPSQTWRRTPTNRWNELGSCAATVTFTGAPLECTVPARQNAALPCSERYMPSSEGGRVKLRPPAVTTSETWLSYWRERFQRPRGRGIFTVAVPGASKCQLALQAG